MPGERIEEHDEIEEIDEFEEIETILQVTDRQLVKKHCLNQPRGIIQVGDLHGACSIFPFHACSVS